MSSEQQAESRDTVISKGLRIIPRYILGLSALIVAADDAAVITGRLVQDPELAHVGVSNIPEDSLGVLGAVALYKLAAVLRQNLDNRGNL